MKKGIFITFEGIDGSGKTTQLEKIKAYLEEKGFDTVQTREPGALETGKKIRNILLHSKNAVSDRCEMFLFLADRAEHIEMLIEPALKAGKIVLCDRFIHSTSAYQGYARGQDIELLKKLNKIAIGGIEPDLTLLFDIPAEKAALRITREKDRMEEEGIEFQKKVRNGYLKLAEESPEKIKIINADKSIDEIFKEAQTAVNQLLQKN